ncbi:MULTISPECIES: PTS lactose/cellobiose transporter subunit IIA [Clostridium]|uniref:PTS lactose/cellobiose transporter subunit IIA n=1 Tax=Clostridium TaxID=1485 RepID=UPI00082719F7|nr:MULTISPECIES: PTS lactose/cellobiose transporter subunit IIA [Clostridium]PJI10215.1 PTS lactose/cellobiose transporter subunit IIA [Clostridium sp. CT7]
MDEKTEQQSMELILDAGNGKALAVEAFRGLLQDKDVEKAKKKLKEAGAEIGKAHNIQTSLLQQDISDKPVEKSILLIHAQDHFMTALTMRDMVELLIEMYEKLNHEK